MTSRGVENHRPTVDAVAARAGVGRGTVSRVINGSDKVSPKARKAVQRAIDELGYVPNHAARSLVTKRTNTVALVVSESESRVWNEPYFAGVIRGMSSELGTAGFQLLLAIAQSEAEHARLSGYLTSGHVDGVLLISLHGDDPLPRLLESRGVPTVLNGAPAGAHPRPDSCVDADNYGGAHQAVTYLAERGRSRIATIAGPQDMQAGLDRLNGYRDGLRAAKVRRVKGLEAFGDFSEASGMEAMATLLSRKPDLDAVFAASDPMALGAMRALKAAGRTIPGDVAVVGFDDSPIAPHADPPLTSVHQPLESMGREMARLLIARIRGEAVEQKLVILGTHLVIRESA